MNTKFNSYAPPFPAKNAQKIKTVGLRLSVTDLHLEAKIKTAFALAKSAGRDLDLTFGPGHSSQNAPQLQVQ